MEQGGNRPTIIVERAYIASMTGEVNALEELGLVEWQIDKIMRDPKWLLLREFMEEQGYERDFDNGKFTVFR